MKKIAVLGNSLTAIKIIEEFKAQGEDVESVFISSENTYPYFRDQLLNLPTKKITQNKIFYRANTEYAGEKVTFIFDKKPTRINFKRGRITLDDKEQIDYDILLLSDLVLPPFFGLKGANKTGLYNFQRLADMSALLKALPVIETIVVASNSLTGLKAALTFAGLPANPPKEVLLITAQETVEKGSLDGEEQVAFDNLTAQGGLRIIAQEEIVEILGDNEAKAVRLKSGKVFGCQAVLTDCDLPDLRLFKETELKHDQRVAVNDNHQTNFANVFAMDAVCDRMSSNEQAAIISAEILRGATKNSCINA